MKSMRSHSFLRSGVPLNALFSLYVQFQKAGETKSLPCRDIQCQVIITMDKKTAARLVFLIRV